MSWNLLRLGAPAPPALCSWSKSSQGKPSALKGGGILLKLDRIFPTRNQNKPTREGGDSWPASECRVPETPGFYGRVSTLPARSLLDPVPNQIAPNCIDILGVLPWISSFLASVISQASNSWAREHPKLASKLLSTAILKFVFRSSCLVSWTRACARASVWEQGWWKLRALVFLSRFEGHQTRTGACTSLRKDVASPRQAQTETSLPCS